MPKCPKCKAEITELWEDRMMWVKQKCKSDGAGGLAFFGGQEINGDADENGDNLHYYCPSINISK